MLVTLVPDVYTAVVRGKDGSTGVALVGLIGCRRRKGVSVRPGGGPAPGTGGVVSGGRESRSGGFRAAAF